MQIAILPTAHGFYALIKVISVDIEAVNAGLNFCGGSRPRRNMPLEADVFVIAGKVGCGQSRKEHAKGGSGGG